MIPKYIHFVFGLDPEFGGKPFSLMHYIAVKSAIEVNQPELALFHYHYEPSGEWWQLTKPLLTLMRRPITETIHGNPLIHFAHKADVMRLQILQLMGGIYLDIDTICVRPFDSLLSHPFVMGRQAGRGLCNAVLMSEPHSEFIQHWLDSYSNFRSQGWDAHWDEHSVKRPAELADAHPSLLHVEPAESFYKPSHEELPAMLEEDHDYPHAYCHHLWESLSWQPYTQHLTAHLIRGGTSTYARLARPYLPETEVS